MFFKLLQIELFKIAKRPRTYISFGSLAILIFLIQFAIKVNGKELLELLLANQSETFEIPATQIINGFFVCFIVLNMLLIHVPLLVSLIAADQISGEANMGTLRFIAGKPVSRTTIILAKFAASLIYVVAMLIWMALFSLFASNVIFGTNDLYIGRELDLIVLNKGDVMWRYFLAFLFASLSLCVIAALAIMISTFSENSIGPIVATTTVVVVFTIIQQLKVPVFETTVSPWLFTTHMLGWKGFFYPQTFILYGDESGTVVDGTIENASSLYRSTAILVGYIVLFISIAIWRFKKKDILS
jgi:ABC-2 type transport system permease protein